MKRERSPNEVSDVPRKRITIERSPEIMARKKQETLNKANNILKPLFETRKNQIVFSIPSISEVLIMQREVVGSNNKDNDAKSTGSQTMDMDTDNLEAYHLLYECKRKKASEYKHRSEEASRNKKLDKISDYVEAFLTYADAFYNQDEARKSGRQYDTFLNPERFFDAVYSCLRGEDPKLIGALKYLHALVIKSYYDIKYERCLETLGQIPDGSAEYNSRVGAMKNNIKECNAKTEEAHHLVETAKELSGNQSLDASNSLGTGRIYAREMVNRWRVKRGINFVAI
ncbi:hypothetical protein Glove_294g146 [Diversispora epigaea]|uniref:Uncharacterized protein n=1 Tax=Diversispora epigaea TaxID=1348612 RepID=A0A397I0V6_9GLOM|nr:hypothetical protein Glove_294g146 [Diversispora epigaea]